MQCMTLMVLDVQGDVKGLTCLSPMQIGEIFGDSVYLGSYSIIG